MSQEPLWLLSLTPCYAKCSFKHLWIIRLINWIRLVMHKHSKSVRGALGYALLPSTCISVGSGIDGMDGSLNYVTLLHSITQKKAESMHFFCLCVYIVNITTIVCMTAPHGTPNL